MAAIHVRQLDDEVVDRLKRRASSNNRSFEGEVRHILECAAADDMAAKRAQVPGGFAPAAGEDQGPQAHTGGSAHP